MLNEDKTDIKVIELGAASESTRGTVPGQQPDGALPQQFIPLGLAAD